MDYKDTRLFIDQNPGLLAAKQLDAKFSVGNMIEFGQYSQLAKGIMSKETIIWQVLARKGRKALLISKTCLDSKPFNEKFTFTTWETCTLRGWLNEEFLKNAFSISEQKAISTTMIKNEDNTEYATQGGSDTSDMVFLLSISEVNKFFNNDTDRKAKNSQFAIIRGAYTDESGYGYWWLRSPGEDNKNAACISPKGSINLRGDAADHESHAIRPALYVDLDAGIF